jgi:hypothetical protein
LLVFAGAGEEAAPEGGTESQPEKAGLPSFATWTVALTPPTDAVLAGIVPFDLASLENGVQKFLAQIEDLGQCLTDPHLAARATPWLLALAGGAAAAWDYSRRRFRGSRIEDRGSRI